MKKKLILKIVLSILFIVAAVLFIWQAIDNFSSAKTFLGLYNYEHLSKWKNYFIRNILIGISSISCALFAIGFFILYNFKDIQWLCGSLAKEIKEHKEATAEERKQKKIEDLQKQLDELKKE